MRSALLASIGEDVKPRLNAIASAARSLRREGTGDRALVATVLADISQLDRYVDNLVDLSPGSDRKPIEAGSVAIDLYRRSVSRDGEEVHLTPKEYAVLAELATHAGRVLTHAHLLRAVWGPAQEAHIDYLRVAVRARITPYAGTAATSGPKTATAVMQRVRRRLSFIRELPLRRTT